MYRINNNWIHSLQINGSRAVRTNKDRLQFIDFGDIRNETCLVIPSTCVTGGTVMFLMNVSACDGHGFLSSRYDQTANGIAVECQNSNRLL